MKPIIHPFAGPSSSYDDGFCNLATTLTAGVIYTSATPADADRIRSVAKANISIDMTAAQRLLYGSNA